MQLNLFPEEKNIASITMEELFQAYIKCRQYKRNTANALTFEIDYESNLVTLCEEINNGTYNPGKSIAFIVNKPVKREIFAADFRDRVVHHLIISKLNPFFEKEFIHDSYACRIDKGTHFGIRRIDRFIRQCSQNYSKDCYVLKLDIKGFFMHIDKNILFEKLQIFIREKYKERDKELLLQLCQKIIYNDPAKNCSIKGKQSNWDGLPPDKSLFYSPENCGLPIGNLTSQVLANFYMSIFDHFIKHDLRIRFYGRYVDDFVLVHSDKEYLKSLIPILSNFLLFTLKLTLHPKKIYLQHYTKGVRYLGGVIKPHRIYTANRTKGNFYRAINKINDVFKNKDINKQKLSKILASTNSYLGLMSQYKTYNLRQKILTNQFVPIFWNFFKLVKSEDRYLKVILRTGWEQI